MKTAVRVLGLKRSRVIRRKQLLGLVRLLWLVWVRVIMGC
jgi:hypothetical protein